MRSLTRLVALPFVAVCLNGAARASDVAPVPYVEVTGKAEHVLDYDRVRLAYDFVAEGRDSADVTKGVADRLSKAVKALEAAGYRGPDVEVSGPRTTPRYAQVREDRAPVTTEGRRLDGYESRGSIVLRTGDFGAISRLTGLMLDQGASMQDPSFFLSRGDELQRDLAPEAARDALSRARRLIEGVGAKPGRVLSIIAGDASGPVVYAMPMAARSKAPAAVDIPLAPGQAHLAYSLTMRVEILQP